MIKRSYYSETSLIVTFYTDRFGKVRLMAKGARRAKSPFRGKLDLFMRNSIVFYHGRGDLHLLKECETIESYRGIRGEFDRIVSASYVTEMLDGLTGIGDSDEQLYSLFGELLDAINKTGRAVAVAACFAIKLIECLGIFSKPLSCVKCGRPLKGKHFFDGRAFRCARCSSASKPVSAGTVRILHRILSQRKAALTRLVPSAKQLGELVGFSSKVFEAESGRKMRTKLVA